MHNNNDGVTKLTEAMIKCIMQQNLQKDVNKVKMQPEPTTATMTD